MFTAPLPVCNNDAGGTFPLYTETMLRTLVYCVVVASFGVISMLSQTPASQDSSAWPPRRAGPETGNTIPAFKYAIKRVWTLSRWTWRHQGQRHRHLARPDPAASGLQRPGGERVIHELTLAEVRQWDCGKVQNPRSDADGHTGTRMPTLDEVFRLAPLGKFDYNIETRASWTSRSTRRHRRSSSNWC